MMKKYDVVAIGNANIDLVLKAPRLPKNDDKVVGKKLLEGVGGTVANSACVMSHLGLNVASLSATGTDYYANKILNDFKKFNVSQEFIDIIPDLEADMAVIILDDSGEKSLIYVPAEEQETTKTQYEQALSQCRVVYTMPGNVTKFELFAQIAHQHQAQIAVDIEPHIADTKEKLDTILTHSDIVFFNKDGFASCVGIEPTRENLIELCQHYQLHTLVVTRGGEGAIAVTVNQWESAEHAGYRVNIVDTTGAGDTFNASFVYALINHYSLEKALEFACACAAISVGYLGARGAIPTAEQVQQFIQQQPITQP